MLQVRKREFWNNAEAERLPDAWRMTKVQDDHILTAVCEVWAVRVPKILTKPFPEILTTCR
jgi:hypothetical protein